MAGSKIKSDTAQDKKKRVGVFASEFDRNWYLDDQLMNDLEFTDSQAAATKAGAWSGIAEGARLKGQILEIIHLGSSQTVWFPAFLKTYQDSYNASWNREAVYGRMDPIQTYSGTQRIVTLNWEIVAADIAEAQINLWKVGRFAKMMYPVYKSFGNYRTISAPPLLGIRHTNLINGVTGISVEGETGNNFLVGSLDSLNNQPNLLDGVFEDASGIYPKIIDLNFTFHPIHTHDLGYDEDGSEATPSFPYNFPEPVYKMNGENDKPNDEIASAIAGDVLGSPGGDYSMEVLMGQVPEEFGDY